MVVAADAERHGERGKKDKKISQDKDKESHSDSRKKEKKEKEKKDKKESRKGTSTDDLSMEVD